MAGVEDDDGRAGPAAVKAEARAVRNRDDPPGLCIPLIARRGAHGSGRDER